jgi:hypothetical protein
MALDPTLACYFATRAFEYRRLERMKTARRQVADNRSHMATARSRGLFPKGTTFEELAADNERTEADIDRLFRVYDWTCAVLDECHVLSFPNVSIEAFDDAWNATASIPGVPEVFDRLPFPVCFIGLGEGVLMDYLEEADETGIGPVLAMGFMVTRDRDVHAVSAKTQGSRETMAIPICIDGEWDPSSVGIAWVLHAILTAMEEVQPRRARPDLSALSTRRAMEKVTKAGAPRMPPPPFYEVRIDGARFQEIVRSVTSVPREFSHQWDVRQHTRTRFLRGTGEVGSETAALFLERGYEIHFAPGADVREALEVRGLPPPAEGEWIATKTWRVKEHTKGPDDRPYVPAVRVSGASLLPGPER